MLEGGANLSANFSLTKYLGRGLKYVGLGFDVENTGLFRIAFDGFMGGNAMSTAINAHASMNELRKLTQIYKAVRSRTSRTTQGCQYVRSQLQHW
jgi:hypothetical protein